MILLHTAYFIIVNPKVQIDPFFPKIQNINLPGTICLVCQFHEAEQLTLNSFFMNDIIFKQK
jgi:hypothetical protein